VSETDDTGTRGAIEPLPADLPVPVDDGAAGHLRGRALPIARLRATDGSSVDLSELPMGRGVIFVYPRTARPGRPLPSGWNEIPGARGCTSQLCSIQDAVADLTEAGARAVYGLSTQDTAYQREAARRLGLAYPLLADPTRRFGSALGLPTFAVEGQILYKRLTMVVHDGVIEHVFYPVFPPDAHVDEVVRWLAARRR
jgi:peroxiredoxin